MRRFYALTISAIMGATLAMGQSTTPIITLQRPSTAEPTGMTFYLGATEETTVTVDFGTETEEFIILPADIDTSTGGFNSTAIPGVVSTQGVIKVYGDASKINFIDCEGCGLTSADITALTNMEVISMNHNSLGALNLDPLSHLYYVSVNDNPFNVTPFTPGGNKPELSIIQMDQLGAVASSFNLSDYPALQSFQAWNTKSLRYCNTSGCPELLRLSVDATSVASIDVSKNPKLRILNTSDSRVTHIDVSHNPELTELYCTNESGTLNTEYKISSLDVSKNPLLKYLYCSGNNLTDIDVSHNEELQDFVVNRNRLTSVNLDDNIALLKVSVMYNDMSFATLPLPDPSWNEFYYTQNSMTVPRTIAVGQPLDLSSKVLREGTETSATVMVFDRENPAQDQPLDSDAYTFTNGILTFNREVNDSIYVVYTNSVFDLYPMTTTRFKVRKPEDIGKPSKIMSFTPGVEQGKAVRFSVGIAGATTSKPIFFYVDFGDGKLKKCRTFSSDIPDGLNAQGVFKGSEVSIYLDDENSLTAFGINNVPVTDIDLSQAESLLQLSVTNAGLTSISTAWNWNIQKLDLSNNNLAELKLDGANGYYTKSALSDINVSYNHLSALDIAIMGAVQNLNISHNEFADYPLLDATGLQRCDMSYNNLERLELGYCEEMTWFDASNNHISKITMPVTSVLQHFNISNNDLYYGILPVEGTPSDAGYVYAPQNQIKVPALGSMMNLTAYCNDVNGSETVLKAMKSDGTPLPATAYSIKDGIVTFTDMSFGEVYCTLTNEAFPALSGDNVLRTTSMTLKETPGYLVATFTTTEDSEVSLSLAGNEGTTLLFDWNEDGNYSEYLLHDTYTLYNARAYAGKTVNVYSYQSPDNVTVFSLNNARMGSCDVSSLSKAINISVDNAGLDAIELPQPGTLRELNLTNNNISEIDLSSYTTLVMLTLTGNPLQTFDLSPLKNLGVAALANCGLTSLTLDNPELWMLDASNNEFTEFDMSGIPAMEQIFLTLNHLSSIDLSANPRIHALYLDQNEFTLTTLPLPQTGWIYLYSNQAAIMPTVSGDKVDLSEYAEIEGEPTTYRWFNDMPWFDEEGNLTGDELQEGADYTADNGVFTFNFEMENLRCVMTNPWFPKLYQYTEALAVSGINGICDDARWPCEVYSLSGFKVTTAYCADDLKRLPAGIYIINGRKIRL